MIKKISFTALAFLFITLTATGQTSLYENPEFDSIAKLHNAIAILPFPTTIELRPKQMEKITPEQFEKMESDEAQNIQNAMHSWFLKRKKRGTLRIEVQEPKRTNALLAQEGITLETIKNYTTEDLAAILGVDAIISGTFATNKPMSDGASIALGLLVGFWGATNTATVKMTINNADDGVLLWDYHKQVKGSIGSNSDDLINVLMRKASRRMAYTKGDSED